MRFSKLCLARIGGRMKKQIIIALLLFSLFVTGCSKHPEPVALEETDTPQILRDETVMFNGLEILFHRYPDIRINWGEKNCKHPFSYREKEAIQQLLDKNTAITKDDEIIKFAVAVLEHIHPIVDKDIYKIRTISHFIETNEYKLIYIPCDIDVIMQGECEEPAFEVVFNGDEMQLLHACWISPSDFSE